MHKLEIITQVSTEKKRAGYLLETLGRLKKPIGFLARRDKQSYDRCFWMTHMSIVDGKNVFWRHILLFIHVKPRTRSRLTKAPIQTRYTTLSMYRILTCRPSTFSSRIFFCSSRVICSAHTEVVTSALHG